MNKEGKEHLRNELMQELWRMNKMDIIVHLMEIIEGETAVLGYLARCNGKLVNPSMISEELNISRARTELIVMEIDDDDRRKMQVGLTEKGRNFFAEKFDFIVRYLDLYVEVIGEEDIAELIRLLKKTVESEDVLKSRHMMPGGGR